MKTAEETLIAWHNPPFGLDAKTKAEITNAMKEFALEVAKETLRNVANNVELKTERKFRSSNEIKMGGGIWAETSIDKESILSETNIPKL